MNRFYASLEEAYKRPEPFEFYTAEDLWTDEHVSEQMLAFHLNAEVDISSRRHAFIDESVEWIAAQFGLGPAKSVADFGCGPGLYTSRLARTEARVTGIDFSRRSVNYARDEAMKEDLSIDYVQDNYLRFETEERFDLIMMIMCDFCALSPYQRTKMLRKFRRLLKPGGAVLLDVYSLGAFDKRAEESKFEINLMDGFWSPSKYYGYQCSFKYEEAKVFLDKYTIVEPGFTRVIYNWLQYFSPDSLKEEFADEGFTVEALYGNVAGSEFDPEVDEFAVVARI